MVKILKTVATASVERYSKQGDTLRLLIKLEADWIEELDVGKVQPPHVGMWMPISASVVGPAHSCSKAFSLFRRKRFGGNFQLSIICGKSSAALQTEIIVMVYEARTCTGESRELTLRIEVPGAAEYDPNALHVETEVGPFKD